MDAVPRFPDTQKLAAAAFDKSGCATRQQFIDLFGGAIGMRTFDRWMKGDVPAAPLAQLVLREVASGWRPRCPK